jgi:hypothetical protein
MLEPARDETPAEPPRPAPSVDELRACRSILDARSHPLFCQFKTSAVVVEIKLHLAARCYAERLPNALGDGDLPSLTNFHT